MQIDISSWISRRKQWRSFENKDTKSSKLSFTFIKRSQIRKCELSKKNHFIISKRWFKKISCFLFLMMLIRNSRLKKKDLINYINARSLSIFFFISFQDDNIHHHFFHFSFFSFFSFVLFILFIIFYIANCVLSLTCKITMQLLLYTSDQKITI
jgi:hypothetical protein